MVVYTKDEIVRAIKTCVDGPRCSQCPMSQEKHGPDESCLIALLRASGDLLEGTHLEEGASARMCAKWEHIKHQGRYMECTRCHCLLSTGTYLANSSGWRYCPSCGAKMIP